MVEVGIQKLVFVRRRVIISSVFYNSSCQKKQVEAEFFKNSKTDRLLKSYYNPDYTFTK